jgi:uncharacterized protein (DUF1330 family)
VYQPGLHRFCSLALDSADVRSPILAFDSVEKAQAYLDTPGQKAVNAARATTTNSLEFIVEGMAN